jgi:hypothetical protein
MVRLRTKSHGVSFFTLGVYRLLGEEVNTIERSTETRFHARQDDCIDVIVETIKYIFMPRHQIAGQNDRKQANKSFENATKLKCLGTTTRNQY